jgi:hypothetical protein
LAIQPEPFLQHVNHFKGNDGFLERFLMISAKPFMCTSDVTKHYHTLFMKEKMNNFVEAAATILGLHEKQQTVYTLSTGAQQEYDHIFDSYAISMRKKYASDSGIKFLFFT